MATISKEKDLEMLRKNSDGTFTKYNPKTTASNVVCTNGKSIEEELGIGGTSSNNNLIEGGELVTLEASSNQINVCKTFNIKNGGLTGYTNYTLSFGKIEKMYGSATNVYVAFYNQYLSDSSISGVHLFNISNEKQSYTFQVEKSSISKLCVYCGVAGQTSGNSFKFHNIQLEKGNSTSDISTGIKGKISNLTSQMADMTKQIENIDLNAEKVTLNSNKLKSKNVKGALEEVFTFASNGKEKIATAITGKGVNSNTDDSFSTLARKINQIELGAKYSSVGNKTTYRNTVIKGDYIYTLEAPNTICKYTKNGELIKKYSAEGEKIAINEKYILRASYNYVSKQINVSLYDIDTNQLILRKALEKATVGSRILMTNNYIYVPETSDRYKMLVYNNYDLSFVKEIMQENCPYFRFFEYPGGTLLKDNTLYTFYVEHWERPEIIQLKEKYAGQFDIIKFYNSNILLSLSNILSGDD